MALLAGHRADVLEELLDRGGGELGGQCPAGLLADGAHLEEYLSALEVELGEQHYQRLTEVSAIALGAPHEDVASALSHGMDGNRRLLDAPHVTVP